MSEGSQLLSTLFLLQVCDINNYLKYATSNSFADDQLKSNAHKNLSIALKRAEYDANNTVTFFNKRTYLRITLYELLNSLISFLLYTITEGTRHSGFSTPYL